MRRKRKHNETGCFDGLYRLKHGLFFLMNE
jgi:hypothetical protein